MSENAESAADHDLDVLFPEREITIGGEKVTVKEINFMQGLKAEPLVRPMIKDLQALFAREEDEAIEFSSLSEIFGAHAEAFLELIALSCGRPLSWLQTLPDEDGQVLAMTFWSVNARFFTRRLVMRTITSLARAQSPAAEAPASAPSSPH